MTHREMKQKVTLPHSLSISCHFTIWSRLYTFFFLFFFLAVCNFKQAMESFTPDFSLDKGLFRPSQATVAPPHIVFFQSTPSGNFPEGKCDPKWYCFICGCYCIVRCGCCHSFIASRAIIETVVVFLLFTRTVIVPDVNGPEVFVWNS